MSKKTASRKKSASKKKGASPRTNHRTIRAHKKRQAFLDALAETASVFAACRESGLARRTAYDWRAEDPDFAAAWDKALDIGTDALEDEATRRAFHGYDEPVHYKGKATSAIRKYSDTLLIFMLKARRPERFKERAAHELTGEGGGPVVHEVRRTIVDPANDTNSS